MQDIVKKTDGIKRPGSEDPNRSREIVLQEIGEEGAGKKQKAVSADQAPKFFDSIRGAARANAAAVLPAASPAAKAPDNAAIQDMGGNPNPTPAKPVSAGDYNQKTASNPKKPIFDEKDQEGQRQSITLEDIRKREDEIGQELLREQKYLEQISVNNSLGVDQGRDLSQKSSVPANRVKSARKGKPAARPDKKKSERARALKKTREAAIKRKTDNPPDKSAPALAAAKDAVPAAADKRRAGTVEIHLHRRQDQPKAHSAGAGQAPVVRLSNSARIAVKIFIASGLLVSVLYALFGIAVLDFNIDNKITRSISRYVPVPALVSTKGIVDYFEYIDARNAISADASLAEPYLAARLVMKSLSARYGVSPALSYDEWIAALNQKVLLDKQVNGPALLRIKKIAESVNGSNFFEIAKQYGSEYGELTLTEEEAIRRFGSDVTRLEEGGISGILSNNEGFAVIRLIHKDASLYSLSYAAVKGVTLDEHIKNEFQQIRFWRLVKG